MVFLEFQLEIDHNQKFDPSIQNQSLIWGMFRNQPIEEESHLIKIKKRHNLLIILKLKLGDNNYSPVSHGWVQLTCQTGNFYIRPGRSCTHTLILLFIPLPCYLECNMSHICNFKFSRGHILKK